MKRRMVSLLLALFLLTATGCAYAAANAKPDGTPYQFYFQRTALDDAAGGDAIAAETRYLEDTGELSVRDMALRLLDGLLAGPESEWLKSPIPAGTVLQSLTVEGSRAQVDLSYAYGSLSGVALSMADYCITLTLTQLSAIYTVGITVRGQELAYRDIQSFTARDVLLSTTEDVVGTVDVSLYFLNQANQLTPEQRTLQLYEGDTQLGAVVDALSAGPGEGPLKPSLPEGFQVRAAWQEENTCYVNLPSSALPEMAGADLTTALRALARSLGSLPQVEEVQFLVDGEFTSRYGTVPVADPYPMR